jgi:hypothetical protein
VSLNPFFVFFCDRPIMSEDYTAPPAEGPPGIPPVYGGPGDAPPMEAPPIYAPGDSGSIGIDVDPVAAPPILEPSAPPEHLVVGADHGGGGGDVAPVVLTPAVDELTPEVKKSKGYGGDSSDGKYGWNGTNMVSVCLLSFRPPSGVFWAFWV